jgi:hypothetical protein
MVMMNTRWIVVLLTFTSCSAPSAPPSRPPAPTPPPPTTHVDAGPSAAECDALIAHAIDLDAHERAPAAAPTAAERAQLRAALDPFVDECAGLRRADYACAIAAASTAQLAACQETRSSSTSNSSVASPGITPAAPREP